MKQIIERWGNNLVVRIPKTFADELGLFQYTVVELSILDGAMLIRPAAYPEPTVYDETEDVAIYTIVFPDDAGSDADV